MEPTEQPSADQRLPKKNGESVSEVVDLGGPVARIERTIYVSSQWTTIVLMVPADHANSDPGGSLKISLSAEQLRRFVETLKWPE